MGELSNRKHEAIAREIGLFGVEPFKAYCEQGFAPFKGNIARLLRDPSFDARVKELNAVAMEKAADLAGVDRARALAEQARIAYSNILDFIDIKDGVAVMKSMDDIPRDKAAAIQSISYDSNGRLRLKLHDKVGALGTLLRATEPRRPVDGDDDSDGVPAEQVATWDAPATPGARAN